MTKMNILFNHRPTLKTIKSIVPGGFFTIEECGNDLWFRALDRVVNMHTGQITNLVDVRKDECAIVYRTADIKLST